MDIKKKRGFTLIELIIVLAVLAIIAVILVPKMGGTKRDVQDYGIKKNLDYVTGLAEYALMRPSDDASLSPTERIYQHITNVAPETHQKDGITNPVNNVRKYAYFANDAAVSDVTKYNLIVGKDLTVDIEAGTVAGHEVEVGTIVVTNDAEGIFTLAFTHSGAITDDSKDLSQGEAPAELNIPPIHIIDNMYFSTEIARDANNSRFGWFYIPYTYKGIEGVSLLGYGTMENKARYYYTAPDGTYRSPYPSDGEVFNETTYGKLINEHGYIFNPAPGETIVAPEMVEGKPVISLGWHTTDYNTYPFAPRGPDNGIASTLDDAWEIWGFTFGNYAATGLHRKDKLFRYELPSTLMVVQPNALSNASTVVFNSDVDFAGGGTEVFWFETTIYYPSGSDLNKYMENMYKFDGTHSNLTFIER